MRKSLADISWQVDEPTYREDPALSYSTLAKFEREGFAHLDTLFDRVESPSLLFGSIVDTLITDGSKAFDDNYIVSDIPAMKPSVEPIVKRIFQQYHNSYTNINDIPDSDLMPIISEFNYQPNWKAATRCNSVRQEGQQYYQTMFMAKGKTVVTQSMYNKAFACVRALKDYPQTRNYFKDNDPFDNVERFYQLKFKGTLNGINYRCMMDLAIVDHENKRIIPCDLKTSSHREYEFPESFIQWQYQIQARLYYRLLRQAMDNDDYFKDFKLCKYRFIVVNNVDNPNPLVWVFEQTEDSGDIIIGDKVFRDPEVIGEELSYYLKESPQVPIGVSLITPNSIEKWAKASK